MQPYRPEHIYIEESVRGSRITRNVLAALPRVPVTWIASSEPLLQDSQTLNPTIPRAKRSLLLARHQGQFFKPCPAGQTRGEFSNVCCNYFVINLGSNCHMECSYCYLQGYLNFPYMVVYANLDELLEELESVFAAAPQSEYRIGTGELADSLALDDLTGYSVPLVEFFSGFPRAVLEFKTKSDRVDRLIGLEHQGRTVVSWSMSPPFIQQSEEHKTSTIPARLAAARRCVDAGYRVGFHLDPLVHYPGWQDGYRMLVDDLFETIPGEAIAWISLGGLRMTRKLKDVMRLRFPSSALTRGEMVPGEDGKLRYLKPIRTNLYQHLLQLIRQRSSGETPVYACMERPEVWRKAFDANPPADELIGRQLLEKLVQLT